MLYNFILLLPSAACFFWSIFLITNWKNNLRSQNILAVAGLMTGISLLSLANFVAGVADYKTYFILDIVDPSDFIPIVMYLYFKSLTSEKRFGWKDYIWFLLPIVFELILVISYLSMGMENAVRYSEDILRYGTLLPQYTDLSYKLHYLVCYKLYNPITLGFFIGIGVYALVSIIRYHYRLRDFYSNLEDKKFHLDFGMLVWFMLSNIVGIVIFYLGRDFLENVPIIATLLFSFETLVIFCLGYYSYRMKYSVESFAIDLEQADKVTNGNRVAVAEDKERQAFDMEFQPDDETGKFVELATCFSKLIADNQIFLNNSLRADEVARMMNTNRTYVSRMLREEFGTSFSDYINSRRIEYAQDLMRSNPDMKLVELAESSGFVNASSFCRIFKQITGTSPKEWLKHS